MTSKITLLIAPIKNILVDNEEQQVFDTKFQPFYLDGVYHGYNDPGIEAGWQISNVLLEVEQRWGEGWEGFEIITQFSVYDTETNHTFIK
jgi:hypothetical protein